MTFLFPPRLLILGVLESAKVFFRRLRGRIGIGPAFSRVTSDFETSFAAFELPAFGISRISMIFGSEFLSIAFNARFGFVILKSLTTSRLVICSRTESVESISSVLVGTSVIPALRWILLRFASRNSNSKEDSASRFENSNQKAPTM